MHAGVAGDDVLRSVLLVALVAVALGPAQGAEGEPLGACRNAVDAACLHAHFTGFFMELHFCHVFVNGPEIGSNHVMEPCIHP